MPRPSRQIDLALLASGMALYPAAGAAGLSVRAVARHADVNPAMFHYHFASKEAFLQALLQRMYEEMYGGLSAQAHGEGPAAQRLHAALFGMAVFARGHRQFIARLLTDAIHGEPVATAFMRSNGPRHVGVLFLLVRQAVGEGALADLPPLQLVSTLMGSVLLPIVIVGGVFDALALPLLPPALFAEQVMEDAAISERITRALRALAPESTAPLAKPAAASAAVPARRAAARRRSASP